jgi:hypothetical protein
VKLHIPRVVRAEAAEAAHWYDEHQNGVGNEFLAELQNAFASIQRAAEGLPRHEEYAGRLDIRRSPLKRFPYDVVFVYEPAESVVLAIAHHRQDPLYWVNRLP